MVTCSFLIAPLIFTGDLHTARLKSTEYCLRHKDDTSPSSGRSLAVIDKRATFECQQAWTEHIDQLLESSSFDDVLKKVKEVHRQHYFERAYTRRPYSSHRNTFQDDIETWENCCRRIRYKEPCANVSCSPDMTNPDSQDCAIGFGSAAAALLPLIDEVLVQIELPSVGRILDIEQDGILQPHDVSTVLWPGGYLLSLWVDDFFSRLDKLHRHIRSPRGLLSLPNWLEDTFYDRRNDRFSIIELGTGVGLSSIAAASSAESVQVNVTILATDKAKSSLALTIANAAINGVDNSIRAHLLDFTKDESLSAALEVHNGPFDLLLGASLQYQDWEDQLYEVLPRLVRDGGAIALVHTTGDLADPPIESCLEEMDRIPGSRYGMDCDCFEIVLLRKKMKPEAK